MKYGKHTKQTSSAKATKRALIASAACTVLCGLLLFSTSIAWFTANKESGDNEIYSGNLDVEFQYSKTMNNNDWHDVKDATDIFKVGDKNMLWEPGAVNVVYFKIENKGTLAAKYDFTVEIAEEKEGTNFNQNNNKFKLSEYIKGDVADVSAAYAVTDEGRTAAINAIKAGERSLYDINDKGVTLLRGELNGVPAGGTLVENTTKTFALVLYMPDDTGDVTNYKTGEGNKPTLKLKVKLVATQMTGESDSFGTDYDKYAVNPNYTVSSLSALTKALTNAENGDVIKIGDTLALTGDLNLNKNVTIVGDGEHAIENHPTYIGATNTVTFKNVKFDKTTSTDKASSVYAKNFNGRLIFDGCTFDLNKWEAVQVTPAGDCTIVFNNCTFTGYNGAQRFIHIQPAKNNTHKLNVTVTNCTFNNCDLVNYGSADTGKGDVIDFDYFAQESTITMGNNTFSLSSGVTSYELHPYFCDAAGGKVVTGNVLLNYLTGSIHTYTVTASGLTQ